MQSHRIKFTFIRYCRNAQVIIGNRQDFSPNSIMLYSETSSVWSQLNIRLKLLIHCTLLLTISNSDIECSTASVPPRAPKRRQQCTHLGRGDPTKRKRTIKDSKIRGETVLMNIAKDISEKWEEVGVYLGLSTKSIKNELSSESGLTLNKKAFHMLLLWRDSTAEDDITYTALAKALEASGLNSCATKYCYTADLDRAED